MSFQKNRKNKIQKNDKLNIKVFIKIKHDNNLNT